MGNKQSKRIRYKLLIMGKLLLSMYLIVFVAAHITSSSGAYFTDSEKETHVLQAGTWWDGSELEFVENSLETSGEQSEKQTVQVELQNNGHAMNGSTTYQVLFAKDGNPKNGDVVKKGEIASLQSDKTVLLNYETADEGTYMFKVTQREGYENDNDKPQDRFSDTITLKDSDMDEDNGQAKTSNSDNKSEVSDDDKEQRETDAKDEIEEDRSDNDSKANDADEKDTE